MSAQCIKCWKPSVRVRNINTGTYKDRNTQVGSAPIVQLTCMSCGWCGSVPFTQVSFTVNSFEFDPKAKVVLNNPWAHITSLGSFPVGG